jgi:plasmid rolling circle replication initiator protein Rep
VLDEHDFRDKKKLQKPIISKYNSFNRKKAVNMLECARTLEFGLYQNLKDKDIQTKKLEKMFTCKDRFCPFCNWRRARKLAIQSYRMLKSLEADRKVRYLFLTLTVKNCELGNLSSTIKHMNKSFTKMFRWERLKKSVLGYARILEYPPQKSNLNYIHPHYHCLIVVSAGYFDTNKGLYIKQKEWQSLWKKALGADYNPSVDIRVIKAKGGGVDPVAKVVAEFAKYPLKSVDLEEMTNEQFKELVKQMRNKRTIAFGGVLKEYRKKLELDDVEDGDLIYDDDLSEKEWQKIAILIYKYYSGEYGFDYYLEDIELSFSVDFEEEP